MKEDGGVPMKQLPDTICVWPWRGLSNDPDGKVRPCCISRDVVTDANGSPYQVQTTPIKEIFNSQYMADLRSSFLAGELPSGCSTCWKDESNGYKSKRLKFNERYSVTDHIDSFGPIREMDVIISNACNLKCRSCTPSHSNSWVQEAVDLQGYPGVRVMFRHGLPGRNGSVFWDNRSEWLDDIEVLSIVGGEPFHIRKWQVIWEELIASGRSQKIFLKLSSNVTLMDEPLIRHLIANFKRVAIGLSVDGLGDQFEYLRHPGKWDVVADHLTRYQVLDAEFSNFTASFTHTISWLNLLYIPGFHQYVRESLNGLWIFNNLVHYPDTMAITSLPKGPSQEIAGILSSYSWGQYQQDIQAIINMLESNDGDPDTFRSHLEFLKRQDEYRGESFTQSFPEMAALLAKHGFASNL